MAVSNRTIAGLKVLVHLACVAPVIWLLAGFLRNHLGPDPTETVTLFTGRGTLRLLVLSLAVTPVRRLIPSLAWLIRFRRMLGLYAFFYACLHLATYLVLYADFSAAIMVDDITQRRFIVAGLVSWLLMLPLALTSTAWSIRKLGSNWARLHRLAYLSAFAGLAHYWWGMKPGTPAPVVITIVFWVLMLARPVLAWRSKRRPPRAV